MEKVMYNFDISIVILHSFGVFPIGYQLIQLDKINTL